jgi:hypothetical protein
LGIIRTQLEAAGLNFDAEPPNYTATLYGTSVSLDLYDSSRNVAVAFYKWASDRHKHEFEMRNRDITFGVFNDGGVRTNLCEVCGFTDDQKTESNEEAMPQLEEQLNQQIEEFIELLREKGII